MIKNDFYVYLHKTKDNGTPFYIGYGSPKWNRVISKKNRNTWWHNIVNKYGFVYEFLNEGLTEEEAQSLEKYWIEKIGRKDLGLGTLVNLTDGGEGKTGSKHTEKTIQKIKEKRKDQIITDEHKRKTSETLKGRLVSDETRMKLSVINTGSKHTEETKQKMKRHKTGNLVLNLETGIFYQSGREAAFYNNINPNTLKNCLSGRRKNTTYLINV